MVFNGASSNKKDYIAQVWEIQNVKELNPEVTPPTANQSEQGLTNSVFSPYLRLALGRWPFRNCAICKLRAC